MEDRFALLIDADNVSAKYIKPILDELSKYGNVTYKRIYGDWTKTNNASWKEELLQNSITPIQQFSYTTGKNATDSAMIIDAMDMLYTSELEGFCLVSSDSDFTKLASRLRESGKTVIGMGEDKTPSPFRKACDIFTVLELLLEDNTDQDEKEEKGTPHQHHGKERKKDTAASKEQIEEAVVKIITENQNNDRETGLGEVGSRLVKLYPDFDVRRYGYSLLSKFLETLPKLGRKCQSRSTRIRAGRRWWRNISSGRSRRTGDTGSLSVPWATGSAPGSGTSRLGIMVSPSSSSISRASRMCRSWRTESGQGPYI